MQTVPDVTLSVEQWRHVVQQAAEWLSAREIETLIRTRRQRLADRQARDARGRFAARQRRLM